MIILRKLYMQAIKMSNWTLFISAFILVVVSSYIIYFLEPDTFETPFNGLWWVMTTITTVGYGDISPETVAGKIYAMFLYIFGIGLIGVVIGKAVDLFTVMKRRREEGRVKYSGENHIIIFGCSKKARLAIQEILESDSKVNIVLVDDLEKSPLLEERVVFVRRQKTDEYTLEQANIHSAKAVIIFADDNIADPSLTDGKSLLIATTIERIAPDMHTTVEIMKEENIKNFHQVSVNEFIMSNETISRLAVRSVFSSGITNLYTQLMSRQHGDDLHEIKKRPHWKTYRDAFHELLQEGATLIADGHNLDISRNLDKEILNDSRLYVICNQETYDRLRA